MHRRALGVLLPGLILAGCAHQTQAGEVPPVTDEKPAEQPAPPPRFDRLARKDFNLRAAQLGMPFFWRSDADGDGRLDPDELAIVWGPEAARRADFVSAEGFTARFQDAYRRMLQPVPPPADPSEQTRRTRVLQELAQGQPTLVETDLSSAPEQDRKLVGHLLVAADLVERIYRKQKGVYGLEKEIPAGDLASGAMFFRNQGPTCVAPLTEQDPDCNALPSRPRPPSGLYPAGLQADPAFCQKLEAAPNAKALMDHFSVVREVEGKPGTWEAIPYTVAYREQMEAISRELKSAAAALTSGEEAAFVAYLNAAAQSFLSNDWEPANEAWAAMGATNSRWYLRIGPDEVYYEPCAWKAGFHLSFARINPDSLSWQQRLEPVKGEMEKALARLAGAPYKAREVKFKLPDFIDIVLNAGDSRPAHGATIGQSLPNWGAVAARGGRTVAMTNLYTDADSQAVLREQMASLYCPATMAKVTTEPGPALMSTVLHEAAHNLGPSHEYKVKGKVDDVIFGGPLASMMEELKAQTAALYFSGWLVAKGVLTEEEAVTSHLRDVAWGFGHISRGMYTAEGRGRPYSQLASIQLGTLNRAGALVWKAEQQAANGLDPGCFEVELANWKSTVDALAERVLKAKGRGDRADAEKMQAQFVDAKDGWSDLRAVISERWLRAPRASFVYSVGR